MVCSQIIVPEDVYQLARYRKELLLETSQDNVLEFALQVVLEIARVVIVY